MFDQIFKLIKVLGSEVAPWQIALGFCLGMCLGVTGFTSLSSMFVLFFILFIRVNLSACLLSFALFSAFAWIFDQLILSLGESLLLNASLESIWQSLYQSPFWLLMQFNNTFVMGSWAISFILFMPLFILSYLLIIKYREVFLAWVRKTKLMQWLKMNKWYQRGTKVMAIAEGLE